MASWHDSPPQGTWGEDIREDKISLELLLDWIAFVTFCICFWLAAAVFVAFLIGVATLPTPWQ